jgi:hypothetical protein
MPDDDRETVVDKALAADEIENVTDRVAGLRESLEAIERHAARVRRQLKAPLSRKPATKRRSA